ncbi:MAG: hypothetical protein ACRDDW_04435 [Candidatus Rhabdochlamydia sp.]
MLQYLVYFFTLLGLDVFSHEELLPSCDPAVHNICFYTTRSLDDGALKSSLLHELQTTFKLDTFVETGTYLANTTIKATKFFNQIHSIELSPELYTRAVHRLKYWEQATIHLGDSKDVLHQLIPCLHNKRVLFYLDGHYSGHVTAKGSLPTPLIEELKAIAQMKTTHAILLIDDIRLFQDTCFPEKVESLNLGLEAYPYLEELVKAILEIQPSYQICFMGDALLAFPKDPDVSISPVMRACALHRLENFFTDLLEEDWKNADLVIAQATGHEKEELVTYYQTYAPFEIEHGYRSYGALWYALIRKADGHEEEAQLLLQQIIENSMPNWRAPQCL